MLFNFDGTKRSLAILTQIPHRTPEELADRGVLNLTWFNNRVTHLRAEINDIDRQSDLSSILQHVEDVSQRERKVKQREWKNIFKHPRYSEVVRDISEDEQKHAEGRQASELQRNAVRQL